MARRPRDWRSQLVKELTPKKRRRKTLSATIKSYRKTLRHAAAKLKKLGILPKTVSARKNITSKAVKKTIQRNKDIIEGKRSVWKLPEDTPMRVLEDLKSMGYRVEGKEKAKKLILPKSQMLRKPKDKSEAPRIFSRASKSRKRAELVHIKLGPEIEKQINEAFKGMKPGDFAGFSIDGHNSYDIFDNPQSMFAKLSGYNIFQERKIRALTVFRVGDTSAYLQDGQQRYQERQEAQRAYQRQRARERRAAKRGMRVTRGH